MTPPPETAAGGHTPGPWSWCFEAVDPEWAVVTNSGGLVIANVNADHRQSANAHLIAAAPDLLAAALVAVSDHDRSTDEPGYTHIWSANCHRQGSRTGCRVMARLDDQICADIEAALEPTGLTFALVLWLPTRADQPQAISVSAPPTSAAEIRTALETALAVLPAKTDKSEGQT